MASHPCYDKMTSNEAMLSEGLLYLPLLSSLPSHSILPLDVTLLMVGLTREPKG